LPFAVHDLKEVVDNLMEANLVVKKLTNQSERDPS
jgi:hypothetical protein